MAAVNKSAAIQAVVGADDGNPIVFTTGYASRIAKGAGQRGNHFYMVGSMGLAVSIGAGIALTTRRTTVVVNGDGGLMMNPGGAMLAGNWPELPLVHIVLDDGRYASTGGQVVPAAGIEFTALARAIGYPRVYDVDTPEALTGLLVQVQREPAGAVFIRCALDEDDDPVPSRIDPDLPGHARRFSGFLLDNGQ